MSLVQFSTEQARAFGESNIWKDWVPEHIVGFQLYQDRLCIPFNVFHEAIEKVLKRPVWTHEFAFPENLRMELEGIRAKPTLQEIMDLIPKDKKILFVVKP